jgi:hypothetical protein
MKTFLSLLILFVLSGCGLSEFNSNASKDKCLINPSQSGCPQLEVSGLGPEDPIPGELSFGGYATASNKYSIPLHFRFLNAVDYELSDDPDADADLAISKLNQVMQNQGHQYIKFTKGTVESVIDEAYHFTTCTLSNLAQVINKYKRNDGIVVLLVNGLEGACAGMAPILAGPNDSESVALVEYHDPMVHGVFNPFAHEIGHIIGFFHTMSTAHMLGLHFWNDRMEQGIVSNPSLVCEKNFFYYIEEEDSIEGDLVSSIINWEPQNHLMKPFYDGSVETSSLFTEGYDYTSSWALDCYHQHYSDS